MFTWYRKHVKHIIIILATLLMLIDMLGVTPMSVQADQGVAAPLPEGVKPPLPEQAATVLVETISAGYYHTCGLKSDGRIICWGLNGNDQSTPPSGTFIQISAGGTHNCGVRSDGTLACWGTNFEGMATPPTGTFTQVSAGYFHSCGVRSDGTLVCWGSNTSGQSTPPAGTFTQVSAGGAHTCGIKSDGTLACWGYNFHGQATPPSGTFTQISAGNNHTCGMKSNGWNSGWIECWGDSTYDQTASPGGTYTQVSAGKRHSCGIKSDGTLACWGSDTSGQATPPAGTFTQVTVGEAHSCAIKSDGTVECWGDDSQGQSTPLDGVLFGRVQVSAGSYHTCELKSDGTLVCWGAGATNTGVFPEYGQSIPPTGTFTQVSAGVSHTCAIMNDGTIACWGAGTTNTGIDREYGQSLPPSGTFTQVGTGTYHTCGLKSDGTMACWGDKYSGQSTPPSGTFTQVSVGYIHNCAIKNDGTLSCWGYNFYGQSNPPSGTFTQVSAGLDHTCGLRSDGTITCWGDNSYGISTPPFGTFTQVSVGFWHNCAIKSDGTLSCWGRNAFGESTPPTGTFSQISAGYEHTCGLRSDGTLTCWGANYNGQSYPFSISGNVGVPGVTLSYFDGTPKTTTSDGSGNYSFAVSYNWSGTVTPSKAGYTFSPGHRDYTNTLSDRANEDYVEPTWPNWYGGAVVTADQNVVTVGRPHIGSEVASYDGFSSGSTTMYVPMLFKQMWGSYDSALYIQNTDTTNTANVTIKFYDPDGVLNCTKTDSIPKMSSHGYWLPSETCLPANWYGGVVITADRNIVAVGRPHIGNQVMTYNGFSSGSLSMYVPMLFKQMWGSYDSAFYVQNTDAVDTANVTIKFYDPAGTLNCEKTDTIPPLSSHGYWLPSETCLPANWYGGVVVTSDKNIVAVGRPHIGSEVTTYNGFPGGSTTMYAPMLFKQYNGTYDSALYIQNVDPSNTVTISIKFYDQSGVLTYTQPDTISPGSSKGYWLPDISGLSSGWQGSVKVESDQPVVGIARPHLGSSITAYDGFTGGGTVSSVPMLFKQMWGSYDSALYLENTDPSNTANVTTAFYDVNGNLSCVKEDTIGAMATKAYWLPSLTCSP